MIHLEIFLVLKDLSKIVPTAQWRFFETMALGVNFRVRPGRAFALRRRVAPSRDVPRGEVVCIHDSHV